MAAVIGDLVADVSRLRDLIVNPRQRSRSQTLDASSPRRSASRLWPAPATPPRSSRRHDPEARQVLSSPARGDGQEDDNNNVRPHHLHRASSAAAPRSTAPRTEPSDGGASRIPSPPSSRSPSAVATGPRSADDDKGVQSMASKTQGGPKPLAPPDIASMSASRHHQQQPSPPADDVQIPDSHASSDPTSAPVILSPTHTVAPPVGHSPGQQVVVHVRDLTHVQTLASTQGLEGAAAGRTKYEISGMPMSDVIEMVAALLTKITATNDLQHDATQRNVAHQQQASLMADGGGGSPMSHSVLAFHGKNVPAISIFSYLSRIHKYCPTTFEVFLSLLVYFDRMTERVNDLIMKCGEADRQSRPAPEPSQHVTLQQDTPMAGDGRDDTDWDIADDDDDDDDDDDEEEDDEEVEGNQADNGGDTERVAVPDLRPCAPRPVTYFVVDSFNIHRLIIAGVTCASKFFSDVFYTNSRYAKVGGLPLAELNHLEIQFLVLNDFRLAVPVEDLEAYATMLVEFYAREVITNKATPASGA